MKKIEADNQKFEQNQQNLMRDIVDPDLLKTYKAELDAANKNFF